MEPEGCNNTFIICRLDFQPIVALRTFSNLEENKMLVWGAKEEPFENGSGDLEDIPVFGQDERSNLIGNINEMSSDSYESQGSRGNDRKRNK